jgi:hypothetical protein
MSRTVVWIAGILALSLLMGGGLWAWMTFASNDQGPRFQTISVDPQLLRFAGGRVIVQARIIDDTGVSRVSGSVMQGDSQYRQLPTQDPSVDSPEFTYITEFLTPPNMRNDGVAADYLVRLVTVDSIGQETIGEVAFQVAAPAVPPAPPPSTDLSP